MFFFPLIPQGQVEASVRLEASAPEDAEFYVVIRGSTLTHVTTAKRGVDGLTLRFTAPGTLTPDSLRVLSFRLVLPLFSNLDSSRPSPRRPRSRWSRRRHVLLLHGGAGPGLRGGSVSGVPRGCCPGGRRVLECSQGAALPSELPGGDREIFHVESRRGARRRRGGRAARFKCRGWPQGSGWEDHRYRGQPGLPSAVEKHRRSSKRGR